MAKRKSNVFKPDCFCVPLIITVRLEPGIKERTDSIENTPPGRLLVTGALRMVESAAKSQAIKRRREGIS